MANVSYINEIDLCPELKSSSEDRIFIHHQSDATIASEIIRGIKLRKKKPPPPSRGKEKFPVNFNLSKPARKRNTHNGLSKSCPGCSSCDYNYSKPKNIVSRNTRLKFRKKNANKTCPMRIAELAIPTKRHCIDTWRNNCNLLPEFMVERLRQRVMDLRPVVQIPEAIYCFRRRKSKLRKIPPKDNISDLLKEMEMPLWRLKARTLCLIFAQKIIQKLSVPRKIILNTDLEKISRVIVGDIVQITKGKRYMTTEYLEQYRSIHSDVINKITVWIVGILEDQAYKQLEEDLRDLEEEEGPVLDFLDDLLDNVLNICLPEPKKILSTKERSVKSNPSDSLSSKHSVEELSNTEYFTKLINNLIPKFDKQFETIDDNIDISDKDDFQTEVYIILDNILKNCISSDNILLAEAEETTDIEYFKNQIINIISMIGTPSKEEVNQNNDTLITLLDNNIENKIDEQLKEIHSSESTSFVDKMFEDTEDRTKKVMFSILNMVKNNDTPRQSKSKESSNFYDNHNNHDIFFAEPNNNLLSNADELWPSENFSPATLRPSASVTKSITSLGKLSESDEKYMSLSPLDSVTDEQDEENHSSETTKESNDTTAIKEVQINTYVMVLAFKDIECQTDSIKSNKTGHLNVSRTTIISFSPKTEPKKIIKMRERRDLRRYERNKIKSSKNKGTITDYFESRKNLDTQWKVSQTAPSWITQKKAHSEPRERDTSMPNSATLTRSDIHKWCADLYIGYKNLDIWKDWLLSCCEETTDQLKKNYESTCFPKKYTKRWQNLKNRVDKDATLWSKMNKDTYNTFQRYQKYYGYNEIALPNCNGRCFCKINTKKPS